MSRKEIHELLGKARRSLLAAERLLRDGDSDFAVSRAYYAMFYAAQALLLSRDIRRSKHSAVIAAFAVPGSRTTVNGQRSSTITPDAERWTDRSLIEFDVRLELFPIWESPRYNGLSKPKGVRI